MFDLRPVGYVIGLLVALLGATMLVPMALDLFDGSDHWPVFLESAIITILCGGLIALSCENAMSKGLSIRQTFLLTTGVWLALPIFGALPFMLGATEARPVDAFFEAMSGLTTTGATVFSGLDVLPRGLLLWRSLMQWFGGIGIIVVAMVFLPELRVGGMQIFKTESFDTFGKILPRAAEIAAKILWIYLGLTVFGVVGYMTLGMSGFDAINHAFTSISTGGMSTKDQSFGAFKNGEEYFACLMMLLASLPFVVFVQLLGFRFSSLFNNRQIQGYIQVICVAAFSLTAFLVISDSFPFERAIREALFNVISIISGTGYASVDYQEWGPAAAMTFFLLGLVGGCAGSTSCSIKIFRYQILFSAIKAHIQLIHSPHSMFTPRYDGRPVTEDVMSSVMSLFVTFIVTLGLLSVALGLTGLDFITSVSGAAAALANIGPGLGDIIGPSGNYAPLNDTAKWLLSAAMLIGRLELLAVYAILMVSFWRA
ncbi:MAG: trk system potassium uptake protein TrkH [Paracoccaceae bacterium]|jgi:trk system potassium uptake protein TrkH